nr:hypothetical protein BaRGS_029275 [Batillaria attramentaria]
MDSLAATMQRIETRLTENIERRLENVEDQIANRLSEVEKNQAGLSNDIDTAYQRCQDLEAENKALHDAVTDMASKIDSLENHSRRNNLLFFGIPRAAGESWESWTDCERKVRQVIQDKLNIVDTVVIERAHRVGEAIIAKFLSYKDKVLILSKTRRLQGTDISIREDFSDTVRQKRKGLLAKRRAVQAAGKRAVLRFDKLVTDEGTYTYDLHNRKVIMISWDRPPVHPHQTMDPIPDNDADGELQSQRAGVDTGADDVVDAGTGGDDVTWQSGNRRGDGDKETSNQRPAGVWEWLIRDGDKKDEEANNDNNHSMVTDDGATLRGARRQDEPTRRTSADTAS